MTRTFPCHGCTDRHEGCHVECERYKAADEQHREELRRLWEERNREHELIEHFAEQSRKRKKRYGFTKGAR